MTELTVDFVIPTSAERVWDVIGPRFDRIGEWATAIPASTAIPHRLAETQRLQAVVRAPVAGRVCATTVRLVAEVTEILIAYDDLGRTLTYEASRMPAFVTLARNTWTVLPIDDCQCWLSLIARFEARGLFGLIGRWLILAQTRRMARHLADDLRHYIKTGTPSPRKQRQLRKARSAAIASPAQSA